MPIPNPTLHVADITSERLIRTRLKARAGEFATKAEAYIAGARAGRRIADEIHREREPLVAWQDPEPLGDLARDALRALLRGLIRWGSR